MKTILKSIQRQVRAQSLESFYGWILLAAAVVGGLSGYYVHPAAPVEPPHEGIWIEFENLQHAIDAASKLGGRNRGLSVCMQKKEEATVTIWNPGIDVHGDLRECGYKKQSQRVAIEMAPNASINLTGLTFSNEQPSATTTAIWTKGFYSHVWLGVSVENQATADERIPLLLQTPAAVRFVSAEPLLGPVSFRWAQWEPFKRDG